MNKNLILGQYYSYFNKLKNDHPNIYCQLSTYYNEVSKSSNTTNKNAKNANLANNATLAQSSTKSSELDALNSYLLYKAKYDNFNKAQLDFIKLIKTYYPIKIGDILHVTISYKNKYTIKIIDISNKYTIKIIDIKGEYVTYYNDKDGTINTEGCYTILKEALLKGEGGYTTVAIDFRNIRVTKAINRMSQSDINLIKTLYM